jgi:3-isopropylmalate dehydrogenase
MPKLKSPDSSPLLTQTLRPLKKSSLNGQNNSNHRLQPGNLKPQRLLNHLDRKETNSPPSTARSTPVIGVLKGTGIGPQVIEYTLQLLEAVQSSLDLKFEICQGGAIGEEAKSACDEWLSADVIQFCKNVFSQGGAVLSGPGGGRYVYDLRKEFDLFCKFVPVRPYPELARAGKLSPQHLRGVDILIVRDNTGGLYQGEWKNRSSRNGQIAEHSFRYNEAEVLRLVDVAARAAASRRGKLHVIVKDGGVPGITALWRDVSLVAADKHGVETKFMNIDLAAYELIQHPSHFDVIVAPNLFGDILADISGVLLSSRGVTFSGNFDPLGNGVYQTNHGCAHDLAGTDIANPAGQMLSLAMLLRESFGMDDAANLIEKSLAEVWSHGWRTQDLAEPGCRIVGTQAMAELVIQQASRTVELKS